MSDVEKLDDQEFGAFPSLERLRLLAEWAPVLSKIQAILSAETAHDKAKALVKLALQLADKTPAEWDDEALLHLEAVLKTAEAKAFCEWLVLLIGGVK